MFISYVLSHKMWNIKMTLLLKTMEKFYIHMIFISLWSPAGCLMATIDNLMI